MEGKQRSTVVSHIWKLLFLRAAPFPSAVTIFHLQWRKFRYISVSTLAIERAEGMNGEKHFTPEKIRIPRRQGRYPTLLPDIPFSDSLTSGEFSFRVLLHLIFVVAPAIFGTLIFNLSSSNTLGLCVGAKIYMKRRALLNLASGN